MFFSQCDTDIPSLRNGVPLNMSGSSYLSPQIGWRGSNTEWFGRIDHKRQCGFHLSLSPWHLCLWSSEPSGESPPTLMPPWWRDHKRKEKFPHSPNSASPQVFASSQFRYQARMSNSRQFQPLAFKLPQLKWSGNKTSICKQNKFSCFKSLNFGVICYTAIVAGIVSNRSPSS